jgi:hypothetical protein
VSKKKDMQRAIRAWKEETGETSIDMHKVAQWWQSKGWPMPEPKSPLEMLSKQLAQAASEQVETDPKTGNPFRRYHAVPQRSGQSTFYFYVDIKEAPRSIMHKSLTLRREGMIGDGMMLTYDSMFWNSLHPEEEPIQMEMDLSLDIQWRLNSADDEPDAA